MKDNKKQASEIKSTINDIFSKKRTKKAIKKQETKEAPVKKETEVKGIKI